MPRQLVTQPTSLLGGFGLAMVAILSGQPVSWVVAALVGGVILRGGLAAGWMGFIAAAVWAAAVDGQLAGFPPREWSGLDGALAFYGIVGVALLVPIGLVAYQLVEVLKGEPWFEPPGRISRLARAIAGGGGAVALVAAIGTSAVLAAAPAVAAYDLTLPQGWNAVTERPTTRDPAYGEVFTAVFGSSERPPSGGPAEHPVVGLSVLRFTLRPEDCFSALEGWPGATSDLFDAPIERHGPLELPAGPAYEVVRAPEPPGTRLYSYALTRTRRIGLVNEPLCYVLAITLPPGSPVSDSDADAIIRSFRFR